MNKASAYRHHAAECRTLAGGAPNAEHRDMLLYMARAWDSLATEREKYIESDPTGAPPQPGSPPENEVSK